MRRDIERRLAVLEQRWPEPEEPDPAFEAEVLSLEENLGEFVKAAWPAIDSSAYQPSWAIDALCEHLQAVTEGQISRLLVNLPASLRKNANHICRMACVYVGGKDHIAPDQE